MRNRTSLAFVMTMFLISMMFSSCSASECPEYGYAEYKPVFFNETAKPGEEMFFIDESRVDAAHYENIKFVFELHKVKYEVIDNRIMVECRAWEDKEFMANMTRDANDKDWLKTQKEFCLKSPKLCPDVKQSTLENLKLDE